ncbi:MAG TPA: host attachment protein [Alphaproteobacteria bacterium]|nr:host attachment protein [Alphaproteobacteria bacterium]
MANKPTLIIVADASRVRVFATLDRGASVQELPGGLNALPPAPAHHHGHGGPTPSSQIHGRKPDSESKEDPRQEVEDKFARDVAHRLEGLASDQTYAGIVIFAPPVFLGNLRRDFSAGLTKKITHEVHKDLTKSSVGDIREHVNAVLFPDK